jgi:hypothetical protein
MLAYELPHECETQEIAVLLAALSAVQRRVLRSYVWQVELGQLSVTAWLRSEMCPVSERTWYSKGKNARYCYNQAFQHALRTYVQAGQRWQVADEERHIARARSTIVRATPRAADRVVENVAGDMSMFFRISERWTEEPLPTQEIVDERAYTDDEHVVHREYRVRYVTLDLDRLRDPAYARLVRKFADSPKNGLSIELYDAQRAAESILDRASKATASKAEPAQTTNVSVISALTELSDDELTGLINNLTAGSASDGGVSEGAAGGSASGAPAEADQE